MTHPGTQLLPTPIHRRRGCNLTGRGPARPGRCCPAVPPAVRRRPRLPLPAQTARAAPGRQPVAIACAALPTCHGERPRRILPVEEGREAAG
jgi:hypothetical protein